MNLVVIFAIATFFATLIGGFLAIKLKKSLPYFFAFSAGSLIAVAFLDLLPESIRVAESVGINIRSVMLMIIISFLIYSFLERFFVTHHHHEGHEHGHIIGSIGAGSLVLHSFLDGVAIGSAFQVNLGVGMIVALAILSHDFTDGINTVTLMLKNKHKINRAIGFLIADAIAPVLGVLLTSLVFIAPRYLALILAFFVGEFLYIGATNLLPETYKHHRKWLMIFWMLVGIGVIWVLTGLA